MSDGELCAARTQSDVVHLAHYYERAGEQPQFFSLCGAHGSFERIEGVPIECRRCRIQGADQLRTQLREIADLNASLDAADRRVSFLREVLELGGTT